MRSMTLKTEGLRDAVQLAAEPGHRAADLRAPLAASIEHWAESERRKFSRPGGWKPDTAAWVAEKRRRGLDPRTMRATGRAMRALTGVQRSAGVEARATRTTLVVGVRPGQTSIYYLRVLARREHGGRKAVVFDKQAKEATAETVLHFLVTGHTTGRTLTSR